MSDDLSPSPRRKHPMPNVERSPIHPPNEMLQASPSDARRPPRPKRRGSPRPTAASRNRPSAAGETLAEGPARSARPTIGSTSRTPRCRSRRPPLCRARAKFRSTCAWDAGDGVRAKGHAERNDADPDAAGRAVQPLGDDLIGAAGRAVLPSVGPLAQPVPLQRGTTTREVTPAWIANRVRGPG